MRKSKYFEVNVIMGNRSDFNDKTSTGRSLKWYTYCNNETFKQVASRLLQVPYVKNVKRQSNWLRVYV